MGATFYKEEEERVGRPWRGFCSAAEKPRLGWRYAYLGLRCNHYHFGSHQKTITVKFMKSSINTISQEQHIKRVFSADAQSSTLLLQLCC